MAQALPKDERYDLTAAAKVIAPILTPLVNRLMRVQGPGVDAAHWKALTSKIDDGILQEHGWMSRHLDDHSACYRYYAQQALHSPFARIALTQGIDYLAHEEYVRAMADAVYSLKIAEERKLWEQLVAQIQTYPDHVLIPQQAVFGKGNLDALLHRIWQTSGVVPDALYLSDSSYCHLGNVTDFGFAELGAKGYPHPTQDARIPLIVHPMDDAVLPLGNAIIALTFTMPGDVCRTCDGRETIHIETNLDYGATKTTDWREVTVAVDETLKIGFLGGQGMLFTNRPSSAA